MAPNKQASIYTYMYALLLPPPPSPPSPRHDHFLTRLYLDRCFFLRLCPPSLPPLQPRAHPAEISCFCRDVEQNSNQSSFNQQPWAGRSSPPSPGRIRSFPQAKKEIARPSGSLVSLSFFFNIFVFFVCQFCFSFCLGGGFNVLEVV